MQTPPVLCSQRRSILRRASRKSGSAFTLVEILVVLAIGAMIMAVAIVNVGPLIFTGKEKATRMFLGQMDGVMLQYQMTMGDYPSTAEGLKALVTAPADKAARWAGPYVKGGDTAIIDQWGEPYQYRYPGVRNKTGFDVWSKGPDKQDGTPDDIGNWPAETANPNGF